MTGPRCPCILVEYNAGAELAEQGVLRLVVDVLADGARAHPPPKCCLRWRLRLHRRRDVALRVDVAPRCAFCQCRRHDGSSRCRRSREERSTLSASLAATSGLQGSARASSTRSLVPARRDARPRIRRAACAAQPSSSSARPLGREQVPSHWRRTRTPVVRLGGAGSALPALALRFGWPFGTRSPPARGTDKL